MFIELPDFLTSSSQDKIPLPYYLKSGRCTKCQVSCEKNSQCGTCQYCQSSCQTSCNGSSMTCTTGCQVKCQTACESGCQTICERSCQTSCQKTSQNNSCGSCQKCQSGCQTTCERNCQTFCENSSQCGTCQSNCQIGCLVSCQSTCEKNSQCSSACEKAAQGCQSVCEKKCQGCQIYSQCGNDESACNYQEKPATCDSACQNQAESCSWIVMSPCDYGCQSTCENSCQTICEKGCQRICQVSHQCGNCETCESCQSTCEKSYQCSGCQSTCEKSCQSACEKACQNCQTACELQVQHVHVYKTYYEQKTDTQHRKYDKCDTDNHIINDILENHIYDNYTFYDNGYIYQICTKCGYWHALKTLPDFEWDVPKGADNSDICITYSEWNRFLDILSIKLASAKKDSNIEAIKVTKHEIITAYKFNLVIDKLTLLKASHIPSKVKAEQLILPNTHLNGIKNSLNSVRKCF